MAVLLLQSGQSAGTQFPLFRTITRVGSDPTADVVLTGEDIAADHAQIILEENAYYVTSVGRGRPVVVNGKREKRARLNDGDILTVGPHQLIFHAAAVPSQETTARLSPIAAYREVVQFSEKLLRQHDLNDLLTMLMDTVVELSHADKGFLILFDPDGEPRIHVARNIQRENLGNAAQQLSDSIVAKVIREGQPIIVTDATTDNEFKSSASVLNLRLCSVMCVPLREAGHILGIIYLGSNRVTHLFEPETLEVTTVFAAQASLLIRNAMAFDMLRSDNLALRQAMDAKTFGEIIGVSDSMQEVYRTVRKVAPTDIAVLIMGETGTGKELIAAEVHRRSPRAKGPFVAINCGAIAENLLESELFGHVRGAFTGAVATREGRFQEAHGGTLFLDEIGEMPVALQVKLLRALQEKVVTKVGDNKPTPVDIRVLAATHRDLETAVKDGRFREDLYYRLHVVGIHLPPLCERGDDVMLLARYFLKRYTEEYASKVKGFAPQTVTYMKRYRWPGNIRQLENRVKKAIIMAEGVQLSPTDMELSDADMAPVTPLAQAKEDFQRRYINEILARNNGNRTKTAHDLGVDPRTIFRHLEREDDPADPNVA